jgi:hypothetical protein
MSNIFGSVLDRKESQQQIVDVSASMLSLEDEYSSLQRELTTAESVLVQQEEELASKELKSIPLHAFQELSGKINLQKATCVQLRERFQQLEAALGEHRRIANAAYERQQANTKRAALLQQISNVTERLTKSAELRRQMEQQEDIIISERNQLLQELAGLASSSGGMN